MRARDTLLLLVGIAAGAGGMHFLSGRVGAERESIVHREVAAADGREPRPVRREVPAPDVPPSPAPGADAPAPTPGPRALGLEAISLELRVQDIALGGAGGPRSGRGKDLPVHPFASRTPEELAAVREKAEKAVRPLLDRWREAAPGEARAAAIKDLMSPMRQLLESGGSMETLLVLEESAERGETAEERRWAVIATHTLWQAPVVDFLQARARSPHQEVRFYAVEGMAWVRGEEQGRAIEGVVRGLDDTDPGVRAIAATSLGLIVGDERRAEDILVRLRTEGAAEAATAMAQAVVALDPGEGRARVASALALVPAEVRAAVEKALAVAK